MADPTNYVRINTKVKDTAFASIIVKNVPIDRDFGMLQMEMLGSTNPVKIISSYTDKEDYDKLLPLWRKFNLKPHSLILEYDYMFYETDERITSNYTGDTPEDHDPGIWNHNIAIAAIDVSGIIQPIEKSPNFLLYNAAFVNCSGDRTGVANKIVYLYVDIASEFEFYEYFINPRVKKCGTMRRHSIAADYVNTGFSMNMEAVYSKTEKNMIITKNNAHLFQKTNKNLFTLSDRPAPIDQIMLHLAQYD